MNDGAHDIFDLRGKVAIVTGASRGLGQSMARTLAKAGVDLVITARDAMRLEPFRREMESTGTNVLPLSVDITAQDDIAKMAVAALDAYGRIDILVNNAGCNIRKPALELAWDEWDRVLDTNLKGMFFCSQAVAPQMIKQGKGKIINMGSAACVVAYPEITAYCSSRGGVLQLTRSLAAEWGPRGVNVNVIAPGWFETEQTKALYEDSSWVDYITERIPLRRSGRTSDLDGALLFLASDASDYVTGQIILIDGGFTTGTARASARKP